MGFVYLKHRRSQFQFINRYSYLFDGVNEGISLPNSINATTALSISAWIKSTATESTSIASNFNTGSPFNGWEFGFGSISPPPPGAGQLYFYIGEYANGDDFLSAGGSVVNNGLWNHVLVSWNGTNATFYINAISQGSATKSGTINGLSSNSLFIGRDSNVTPGRYFGGNIDEVGFFNTNLTAQQITEIYNNGKPKNLLKHSASSNLVSYFRMGDNDTWDGTNWTLIDKKGTNNGTSSNMEFVDNELDVI